MDFILAVGGGSAIDSAKAIGVGVPYEGDFWDFYRGRASAVSIIPIATVLTLAGTGSEGSRSSVITNEADHNIKDSYSTELMRPVFSILNPELMFTLSPYQTACGVVDMMAHIFERYLSNTRDVDLSDRMSEAVLKAIMNAGLILMKEPENYQARATIMWAGMIAHNDILGADRQQDWSSHNIEHELSALYDVAHGAGLAVISPAFMSYTLQHDIPRYAQLAVRVFDVEADFLDLEKTAKAGIVRYREFLRSMGMPLTFADLGAREEDIPELTARVIPNNGDKVGYFQPLDREDIAAIYRLCL